MFFWRNFMKSIFSKDEIEFMKNNYLTMTYKEIADCLGFSERQIRGKLNNMGLTKLRKFDKHYFDVIDCAEKAYWIGFIYADGYIICRPETRNYELGIELQDVDKYLLERLNDQLGGVHKILDKHSRKQFNGYDYETDSCVLRVYCKQIIDSLIKHGIVQNKTYSNIYPSNIPDEYFYAFVRGFLDGDGCIYVDQKQNVLVQFTNSNLVFLKYLSEKIQELTLCVSHLYMEKDRKYRLTIGKKSDVYKFLNWIYDDLTFPYLERKYIKYLTCNGSPNEKLLGNNEGKIGGC